MSVNEKGFGLVVTVLFNAAPNLHLPGPERDAMSSFAAAAASEAQKKYGSTAIRIQFTWK